MGGIDTIVAVVKNPSDTAFARPRTTTHEILLAKPAYEDSQSFSLCQSGAILSGRVLSRRCYQAVRRLLSTTSILVKRMVDRYLKGKPTWFFQAAGSLSPAATHPTTTPCWTGISLNLQAAGSSPAPTPPHHPAGLGWEQFESTGGKPIPLETALSIPRQDVHREPKRNLYERRPRTLRKQISDSFEDSL